MANPHQELWNNGQQRASECVVIVESCASLSLGKRKNVEPTTTGSKISAGFIVENKGDEAYIAVHESQISLGGSFEVFFPDGPRKTARVLLQKTACHYVILSATLDGLVFRKVQYRKITARNDILMLSALGNTLHPFISSVINPNTNAISLLDWRTIVDGSEKCFSFGGCRDNVKRIMGAPIFSIDGSFGGVVVADDSTLPEYSDVPVSLLCRDLKYGQHGLFFLSNLRKEIKDKLDPKPKVKNMRNTRRR